jgi:DNA repair exonuclease SbcCD nuclease subunit
MPDFSFIHAADLHLDSPFSTLSPSDQELKRRLRISTFEAYDNLIRLCLERRVDFLLVAGDVYDGPDRSLRAQIRFRNGLQRLHEAGIQTLVVHGNHDPLEGWSSGLKWPSSVHIFGSELETVEVRRDEALLACVQGISYPRREEKRNLARLFDRTSEAFHIGLLHATAGSNTGHAPYAPCTVTDLINGGMDYWALGHVHNRRLISQSPVILYSGNSQGRNIREQGERGCYLVEVDQDFGIRTCFQSLDVVRWIHKELPIEGLESEQDLMDKLENGCQEISGAQSGRASVVRITLTGSGPLYKLLNQPQTVPQLEEGLMEWGGALSPPVWIDRIRLRTRPEINLEAVMAEDDFLGEIVRCVRDLETDADPLAFFEQDLKTLYQSPKVRRYLEYPDKNTFREWLERAQGVCLHHLSNVD